mmetsp:Transcript_17826/g.49419  ORF Transcript_17826/g.49419 Transcript_17826/m.49419 type:complete len:130 (+) Transcript_17826:496-885(+)
MNASLLSQVVGATGKCDSSRTAEYVRKSSNTNFPAYRVQEVRRVYHHVTAQRTKASSPPSLPPRYPWSAKRDSKRSLNYGMMKSKWTPATTAIPTKKVMATATVAIMMALLQQRREEMKHGQAKVKAKV